MSRDDEPKEDDRIDFRGLPDGRGFLSPRAGWVVGSVDGELLGCETEKHLITIAGPGGGKGVGVAIPNLLTHPNSVLSVEIGGSNYHATHNFRRHALKQDIHVIDPFGQTGAPSARINLLDTLDPGKSSFFEDTLRFATSMVGGRSDIRNDNEKFFHQSTLKLTAAHLQWLMTSPEVKPEERNLSYLSRVMSDFATGGPLDKLKVFADAHGEYKDYWNSTAKSFLRDKDGNDTTFGIHASVDIMMSFTHSPAFKAISRDSTVSLDRLRDGGISIYVVMPSVNDYDSMSTWLRLLVDRSLESFPNHGDGGKSLKHPRDRALFLLDEFTHLGKIDSIEQAMLTARQNGITVWALFQTYGALQQVYGKEGAEKFMGGAGVVQVFDVADETTKDYVSKRSGDRIVHLRTFTDGTNWSSSDQHTNSNSTSSGDTYSKQDSHGETHGRTRNDGRSGGKTHSRNAGDTWNDAWNSSISDNWASSSNTSEGTTSTRQDTFGQSTGKTDTRGGSSSMSTTEHFRPVLTPAGAEKVLCTGKQQIIFVRAYGQSRMFLNERPFYFDIEELNNRVNGWPAREVPLLEQSALSLPDFNQTRVVERLQPLKLALRQPDPVQFDVVDIRTSDEVVRTGWLGKKPVAELWSTVDGTDEPPKSRRQKRRRGAEQHAALKKIVPAFANASTRITTSTQAATAAVDDLWSSADAAAAAIGRQYIRLRDQWDALSQKDAAVKRFERSLKTFRMDLRNEKTKIEEYGGATDDYQQYLQRLVTVREEWRGKGDKLLEAPSRPAVVEQAEPIEDALGDLDALLDPLVPEFTTPLPALPGALSSRDRTVAPSVAVADPLRVARTGIRMQVGKTEKKLMTLSDLDADIEYAERHPFMNGLLGRRPKLDDLYDARLRLAGHIRDNIKQDLNRSTRDQQRFSEWLMQDWRDIGTYTGDIISFQARLDAAARTLDSYENRMDQHIDCLEHRADELGKAHGIIGATAAKAFTRIAKLPEWDRLEQQTQHLLEHKPDKNLIP